MTSDTPESNDGATTKVGKILEKYDLDDGFGDRLEAYWLGEGVERKSLRDLADLFNRELLAAAMEEDGMTALDGEVKNLYRLLTDDDITSGTRVDARRRLTENGIDVEALERDFVSYQAIRTYLKDVRGADYESTADSDADRVKRASDNVRQLKSRTVSVAEGTLEQLDSAGEIAVGESHVILDMTVICEDCNSQFAYEELLTRGGCDCDIEG